MSRVLRMQSFLIGCSVDKPHNVVHRSDSIEATEKETGLFFKTDELQIKAEKETK